MQIIKQKITRTLNQWRDDVSGLAAVEAAFIFPILLTMLLGLYEVGNALLANQKTIRASQVVADLVTRSNVVSNSDIDEAVQAGRLAFQPISADSFGVDIVSVRFDDDENASIVWRETRNMTAIANILDSVEALAEPGGGVVVVSTHYDFEPMFAGFITDQFTMSERAFARGRRGAIVEKE